MLIMFFISIFLTIQLFFHFSQQGMMGPSMARMPQSTMYSPFGESNQGQYMYTGASSTAGSGNTGYIQQMQQGM